MKLFRGSRVRAALAADVVAQVFVPKRLHSAAGVADQKNFLHAQLVMRDQQRPQDIFGHDPAGIANDIRIAGTEAQALLQRDAVIHAGDHRQFVCDRRGRPRRIVSFGELLIGLQHFI